MSKFFELEQESLESAIAGFREKAKAKNVLNYWKNNKNLGNRTIASTEPKFLLSNEKG